MVAMNLVTSASQGSHIACPWKPTGAEGRGRMYAGWGMHDAVEVSVHTTGRIHHDYKAHRLDVAVNEAPVGDWLVIGAAAPT
jgi:hypothetical protein